RQLHTLRPIGDQFPRRPARHLDAATQLVELALRYVDAERPDRILRALGRGVAHDRVLPVHVRHSRSSICPVQLGFVSPSAASASCPAWRTAKAVKIWEKPRNNARNPTQNKIRKARWPRLYTRSEPDTQNASRTSRIPVIRPSHQ